MANVTGDIVSNTSKDKLDDEHELEEQFDRVTKAVATGVTSDGRRLTFTTEEKLHLYGLYSVAKKGPASSSVSSSLSNRFLADPIAHAKLTAWQSVSHLTCSDAKRAYIELVDNSDDDDTYTANNKSSKSKSAGTNMGWGRTACNGFDIPNDDEDNGNSISYDADAADTNDEVDNIWHWVMTGNVKRVNEHLKTMSSKKERVDLVNAYDEDGLTMLIRAVDKGDMVMTRALLRHGALVNLPDRDDKQTPLHYAVTCMHVEVMRELLHHGADPSMKDGEGLTCTHIAESNNMQLNRKRSLEVYLREYRHIIGISIVFGVITLSVIVMLWAQFIEKNFTRPTSSSSSSS